MKRIIICLCFFNGILQGQSVLQSIQTKTRKEPSFELQLNDIKTQKSNYEILSKAPKVDSSMIFQMLIDHLENSKKDANLIKDSSLKMELKKQDSLKNLYYRLALKSTLEVYKTRENNLSEYLRVNSKLSRACEVNYYLLEDKIKDIKLFYVTEIKNKNIKKDSIDAYLSELYLSWFDIELVTDNLKKLSELSVVIAKNTVTPTTNIDSTFKEADTLRNTIERDVQKINNYQRTLKERMERTLKLEENNVTSLSATPVLNNFANKYSPSLSLLGMAKYGKSYNEIGLFTGGLFSNSNSNREGLYFSDLSDFAVYYKGATTAIALVDSNQKTGLNYEVFFMSKQFGEDTSIGMPSFTYQSIQLKAGFEYVVFRNIISTYANVNYHLPLNNKANLTTLIGNDRLDQINFDLGVKMLLNPAQGSNGSTKLFVDINLMFLTEQMKIALKTGDDVLPNLKIGVQQRLAKFD